MAKLVVNPGSPAAWEIRLKPGCNTLGRGFSNDFTIQDPSISGSHCQIVVSDDGVTLIDSGSTNGTFIEEAQIQQARLEHGQNLRLGNVPLAFFSDDTPIGAVPVRLAARTAPTAQLLTAETSALPPLESDVSVQTGSAAQWGAPPLPAVAARMTVVGPQHCKHHPKVPARHGCPQCGNFFCDFCVGSRRSGPVVHKTCRHCGIECFPVQVQIQRTVEASFFQRLPSAFVYPFRGAGVLMVVVGMVIVACMRFGTLMMGLGSLRIMMFGLILQIFTGGYLFSFLQNIIHSTAAEDKEMPDLPGFGNFLDDILLPFLRLLGLMAMSFGPAILLAIWIAVSGWTSGAPVLFGAIILGALYFPMAFLAVAILDTVTSANPLVVIPSILKVPLEYFVTLITLGAVFGFRTLGDLLLPIVFPDGLSTDSMPVLFAYIGASVMWGFFSLYLLLVGTHLLGLLYVTKKKQLGWLERS